jgi:hypothetical protein
VATVGRIIIIDSSSKLPEAMKVSLDSAIVSAVVGTLTVPVVARRYRLFCEVACNQHTSSGSIGECKV